MISGKYDSKLVKINVCEYRLDLVLHSLETSLATILSNFAEKTHISKKADKDISFVREAEKQVNSVEIKKDYFNYILVSLKSILRQEDSNAKESGYVLLDKKITKCELIKNFDTLKWDLKISLQGKFDKFK